MNENDIERLLIQLKAPSRRREVLNTILTSGVPIRDMFIKHSDIVSEIFPEFASSVGFDHNSKYHQHDIYEHSLCVTDNCKTTKFEVKLAALFHDIGKPDVAFVGEDGYTHYHGHPKVSYEICKEMLPRVLNLKGEELDRVLELIKEHDKTLQADEKSIRRFITNYGEDFFEDWLILKQADIDDHINITIGTHCPDIEKIKQLHKEILEADKRFKLSDLAVNGNDLIEIGIHQGKEIGKTLNLLFEKVEKGCLPNIKHILLDYCKAVKKEKKELTQEL